MPEKIDIVVMDTGARRPEVLGLRLEDVDLDTGRLTVTGKGSRTRVIQVGASLKRVAGPIRCAFRCRRRGAQRPPTRSSPYDEPRRWGMTAIKSSLSSGF